MYVVSSLIINFPIGLDDLSKVFEVSEFLENKEELAEDFKPEVQKYLIKKDFFTGPFRREYDNAFEDLIVSLIKRQLVQHFNYTPEELMLLTDKNFLKLITEDYYFKPETYITKEGNSNEQCKNSLQ